MKINLDKKILFLIACAVILAIWLFIFIFSLIKNTPQEKPIISPTKTPVLSPTKTLIPLNILSSSPKDKDINVGIYPLIDIVFSRPLTTLEKDSFSFSSSPDFNKINQWNIENNSVAIILNEPLKTSQKYTLSITYGDTSYSWSFTTVDLQHVSEEDQIQVQKQADKNFAQWQADIYKNYPWYDNLPLKTNNYFVYFDVSSKKFIANLYPSQSSPMGIDNQVNIFKEEILAKLKKFNIEVDKYEFSWKITPKP